MSHVIDGPLIYWPLAPGEIEKLPDPRQIVTSRPCYRCDMVGAIDVERGSVLDSIPCPTCHGQRFLEEIKTR